MTQNEIDNLIAFAREFDRRLGLSRIKQKELSAMTGKESLKPISPGYISDILSVARGNSKKYFRLTREKVVRLAKALDWPLDDALPLAGYANEAPPSSSTSSKTPIILYGLANQYAHLPAELRAKLDALAEAAELLAKDQSK